MTSFDGRLRVPGQSRLPMGVVVDISDERMKLMRGDRPLGDWPLAEVNVAAAADGFHLDIDGESAVLSVADAESFANQLGITGYQRPTTQQSPADEGLQTPVEDATVSDRLKKVLPQTDYADIEARLDAIERALRSNEVSPQRAFAHWLDLLNDLSDRHSEGAMPCNVFHRFNKKLIALMG